METVSVSKGVFPSKAYVFGRKKVKNGKEYCDKPWYLAYRQMYKTVENSMETLNCTMYEQIVKDLSGFVESVSDGSMDIFPFEIPTAILLAGINVPDHMKLFDNVVSKIKRITPYIATISSKNCSNMKSMVEESIYQLMNGKSMDDPIVKKTHCTFRALEAWYKIEGAENSPLVIIIQDFENFSDKDLHDFVFNLSAHSTFKIVLIFGIATSLHIVHRTLSYDVTSKLRVKVFSAQTQLQSLSDAQEGVVFSYDMPFKLIGKAFNFLRDMFLFYDLSVHEFLQAYKICLATHFFNNNCASLCCDKNDVKNQLAKLTTEDIQNLKKIHSIAYYCQGRDLNDKELKTFLENLVNKFQTYMHEFLSILKCFHAFAKSCPSFPGAKLFREIYSITVCSNLTDLDDYTKVLQYLSHSPKEELLSKLDEVMKVAKENENFLPKGFLKNFKNHFVILRDASEEVFSPSKSDAEESPKPNVKSNQRLAFHNDLKTKAYRQSSSPYKQAREKFVNYLDKEVFSVYLKNPTTMKGFEIFCFHDSRLVNRQIKGSLRAAIENALKNPSNYLECSCCKTKNDEEVLSTMPDLSIVYKLHTENKKMINMHDWLQSFLVIIDPMQDDEQQEIDPVINSRFSQAVAELQFLGYIKETKRKTDHVKKLV